MKTEVITSIKDERVVFARSLQKRSERIRTRSFLVEGKEAIEWVIKSPCELWYIFAHDKEPLESWPVPVLTCSEGILKKISTASHLIPFIGIASLPEEPCEPSDLMVIFDGVQDFGNIGTIVRTASAFGIDDFASTSETFDLFQRKSVDVSRGTVFSSRLVNYPDAKSSVAALKKAGYQIVVTALEGSTLQSLATLAPKKTAIVFGNETNGVSKEMLELADLKIQIPLATSVDSLNVGVAAGITLYEIKLKVILMKLKEKIQGSLGRNLSCAHRFLRSVFDEKLQAVSDLTAEQAILLMVLACDEEGEKEEAMVPLIEKGYLIENENVVRITDKGREVLGAIWNVQEAAENRALAGFLPHERKEFLRLLEKVQSNLLL